MPKGLYFTAVIYFFLNFVSYAERPAMGSQPNLASRSEVVSIYKSPRKKIWGLSPKFGAQKTSNCGPLPHSTPHISGTKRRIDKQKH